MEKTRITFPNLGEDEISTDVVSKWIIESTTIIGDTIFCKAHETHFSMSTKDYNKIFK
jgi:hypothetical protein